MVRGKRNLVRRKQKRTGKKKGGWNPFSRGKKRRGKKKGGLWRKVRILAIVLLVLAVTVPPTLVLVYRTTPPPVTLLMLVRLLDGHGIKKEWVPLDHVSYHVPAAVIALEDNLFCSHNGFDWAAIFDAAADQARGSKQMRGGSTITQQTAKNVFLWPGRTMTRKAFEVPFAKMMESVWGKRRIMEVYLNVIEWGPGIYGVEAAARYHFNKSAKQLSRNEAALLASVLPNPLERSARHPSAKVTARSKVALARINQLGDHLECVR